MNYTDSVIVQKCETVFYIT